MYKNETGCFEIEETLYTVTLQRHNTTVVHLNVGNSRLLIPVSNGWYCRPGGRSVHTLQVCTKMLGEMYRR